MGLAQIDILRLRKNRGLELIVFFVAVFVDLARQNLFEVFKILVVDLAASITFLAFFASFIQGGSLAFKALNKIS